MTEKQYRLNKWGTRLLKNNRPLFDWTNEGDAIVDLLNELADENEQLREHFIYLIATALEDKECRKIYAKGLLEIFDDCADLDEAKIKIREYLE